MAFGQLEYETCLWIVGFSIFYWIAWSLIYHLIQHPREEVKVLLSDEQPRKKLTKDDYYYIYINYISMIHALSAVCLSAVSIYMSGTRLIAPMTYLERIIICNSFAYFIFNTLLEWAWDILEAQSILHHSVSVVPMIVCVYYDYGGSTVVYYIMYGEMSNPFYIIRNNLRKRGLERTAKYVIALWVYGLVFAFWRLVMYSILAYKAMVFKNGPLFFKFLMCLMLFISYGWCVFLYGLLFKSIPDVWDKIFNIDRESVANANWYTKGRNCYTKWLRTQPRFSIAAALVIVISIVIPFSIGVYWN